MAGQGQPSVTYTNLLSGVDITKNTIQLWLQVTFGNGPGGEFYTVGGIAAGLKAYASSLGISANAQFLAANIGSEVAVSGGGVSLPTTGGYVYKYIPSTDVIQIFQGLTSGVGATSGYGIELGASEPIPPGVLDDIIVMNAVWNRL